MGGWYGVLLWLVVLFKGATAVPDAAVQVKELLPGAAFVEPGFEVLQLPPPSAVSEPTLVLVSSQSLSLAALAPGNTTDASASHANAGHKHESFWSKTAHVAQHIAHKVVHDVKIGINALRKEAGVVETSFVFALEHPGHEISVLLTRTEKVVQKDFNALVRRIKEMASSKFVVDVEHGNPQAAAEDLAHLVNKEVAEVKREIAQYKHAAADPHGAGKCGTAKGKQCFHMSNTCKKAALVAAGVSLAVLLALPEILEAIGFEELGVALGSRAAGWQSKIGDVEAGSLFATFQSIGAAGMAGSPYVWVPVTGAAFAASFCALVPNDSSHFIK